MSVVDILTHEEPLSPRERKIAALCHLSALLGMFIPMFHVISPLIIWLLYRDRSLYIDDQGREAVNFQLSLTCYLIASLLLVFIFVGIFFMSVLAVFSFISVVIATVKASQGHSFRYQLNLRII